MKIRLLFLLALPFLMASTKTTTTTKVNFIQGNLKAAKDQAAVEGKLYFVDFVASWCMPCRWMDETTFSDEQLASYVDDNYLAVKIDIDDFDGFAYKQMYNIKMLPSILIFNSQGKLLAQYEESLAPSKMLAILKKYDQPQNRVRSGGAAAPARPTQTLTAPAPATQPARVDRPADHQPARPVSKPTTKPVVQPATPARPAAKPKQTTTSVRPTDLGTGLYRFKVSRQANNGFSVQIGAFYEYGNVLREAAKLEQTYEHPIIVHIATKDGKPIYKILVGEFNQRADANRLKVRLKQSGLEGFVADLSTYG